MKKYMKDMKGIVVSGTVLGVGSSVLSSVGSTEGSKAMGNIAGFLPLGGTIAGTGMTLRQLKKMKG
jgi:hypothetical protein